MNRRRMRKLAILVPIGILAVTIFGLVVMSLWNYLVPAVFGGKVITFWQALGILVLSRILFGGFFERRRRRFVNKWEQLSPEEQEKFRAAMAARRGEQGNAPA